MGFSAPLVRKLFRRLCVAVMKKVACDATKGLGFLCQVLSDVETAVPVVFFVGGPNLLG